jgi:glycosyltransferase involved in cell wall biosynthesis
MNPSTKPKIFHLLDDQSTGGITASVRHMASSQLREEFEFQLVRSQNLWPRLQQERPDIIICNNPSSWRRLLPLAMLKRYCPHLIIQEHHYSAEFIRYNVKHRSRFCRMLRWSYHLADRVVAVSQGQANWMAQQRLLPPRKLTQINQCLKLDRLLTVPETQPKERPNGLTLATYGRFCPQKGFDILLQAMHLMADVKVHLHIGGAGADREKLQQLAQSAPNIQFWGAIDDCVPAFLAAADVVVIPSRWEPWGNVCVESRAAGKPIIASDVDGLREQVQNCGLLVPPNDPQAIAAAIRTAATLPRRQLQTWGHNARDSVHSAWENHLEQWRSLLWEVLRS